jgi:hypothetical protein
MGDSLRLVRLPFREFATVSADGAFLELGCTAATGECTAPIADDTIGAEAPVPGWAPDERVVGWRGSQLVVSRLASGDVPATDVGLFDPRTATRTPLGTLDGDGDVTADPSARAFTTARLRTRRVRAVMLGHPGRDLVAEVPAAARGRSLDHWELVTPTLLVSAENKDRKNGWGALVAFTPDRGRTVITPDLDSAFTATADRVAFVEHGALVWTDLAGGPRVILRSVPKGVDVTPLAWMP